MKYLFIVEALELILFFNAAVLKYPEYDAKKDFRGGHSPSRSKSEQPEIGLYLLIQPNLEIEDQIFNGWFVYCGEIYSCKFHFSHYTSKTHFRRKSNNTQCFKLPTEEQ